MKKHLYQIFRQLLLAILLLTRLIPEVCAQDEKKAAVFISDTIKPYYEAVRGIESELGRRQVKVNVLDVQKMGPKKLDNVCNALIEDGYLYWVSIGPKSMKNIFSLGLNQVKGRVYSMVLAPPERPGLSESDLCGVSLQIPVKRQVREIIQAFSTDIRPGIIYDPKHNASFAERAFEQFQSCGVHLNLLKVKSRADVHQVIAREMKKINLLWMIPDQTVISESIIQYMIKQALKAGVGVIGYNTYFLKQGAVAAFVIDYETVGRQSAQILFELMRTNMCESVDPEFKFNVNDKLIQFFGFKKPLQPVGYKDVF